MIINFLLLLYYSILGIFFGVGILSVATKPTKGFIEILSLIAFSILLIICLLAILILIFHTKKEIKESNKNKKNK